MPRHRRGWAIDEPNEYRTTPLMGALVEPVLLALLVENPQHGYNLLNALEKFGVPPPHPSVVYRTLREMEALRWISSDWDADTSLGPPRRMYSLTDQGKTALQNWLAELHNASNVINRLIDGLKKGG